VGFLENNHGITYSELADVLRTVEAPGFSLLSGILEGYQGGAFTRILKDIYASGLAVLMRKETAYSPHKPRFVQEDTDDLFIGLITTLEKFSVDSQLINFRLLISPESSSITSISDDRGLDFSLIANLSNKPLDSYSILIESLGPDRSGRLPYTYNKTILQETINSGGVSEPPGLGNSPRLTREYPEGILSPELGFLLEKDLDTTPFSSIEFTSPVPFVKIDKENLYQRRISDINYSTIEGIDDIGSGGEEYRDGISVERLFNTLKSNSFDPTSDYIVEKIPAEVSIPISGSYYITNNNIYNANFFDPNLSKLRFNPIESCIEFGTSEQKCRQLFKDYQEVSCKEYLYNKSSLIEQSPRPTTLVSSSIPLDRPLGVSGSLNPSGTFLQNPYKRLPHYIEDNEIEPNALSSSGEPLGVNISLLENLPGLENTSIGLNSFLRKNPKPKNEQECSRYIDINNIQKCFNVLRCMKLRDRRPKYCEGLEYD
jgi:hypothetical protein